tara:strand:- start:1192 stop:1635 length:444 start_codon:yes stop_codon:yes gene_type:complete
MKIKATGTTVGTLTDGKEYTVLKKGDRDVVIINDIGKQVYATITGQCPLLLPDCEWEVIKDSIDDATEEEWSEVGKKLLDEVNKPEHYNTGAVECIDAIQATLSAEEFQGYCRGNTLKYLWRCMYKGKSRQDLEKAQWYLDRLLDTL